MMHSLRLFVAVALAGLASPTVAQVGDEIIVTASRVETLPGVVLEVQGDFLVVDMSVYNDSREIATRGEEIEATLKNLANAARANRDIELSLLIEDDIVRPFSLQAAIDAVGSGAQPQTSEVSILAKTPIPDRITNSYALVNALDAFAESVETVGRSSVSVDDEPQVSIENPRQYRMELIKAVITEIETVTNSLGGNYRVVLQDIDEAMKITRGSDLSLLLYIPYDYEVIPTSLNSRDSLTLPEDY